jgi:predicted PurR-regulated permease PerM
VLAGLFEFIPLIGPVLALGPALLLALADSPQQAAWVLLLYSVVQTSESYIITPLVQRRAVELPPVLTITAQIALSWAAGPVGLVVAVPLTAVVMLYLRDALDDEVEPAWAATSRREVREERDGMLAGLLPD